MYSEQYLLLINSLKSGDLLKIKQIIDCFDEKSPSNLTNSQNSKKNKEKIEKCYYKTLSKFLTSLKFEDFKKLFNYSDKLEIFIDVKKIPYRFRIISNIHLNCIQTGQNGYIFDIIRFFNNYNLFDRDFSKEELEVIKKIKKDKLLIENLKDLFGKTSDSLLFYVCKILPQDLSFLLNMDNSDSLIITEDNFDFRNYYNLGSLLNFFNRYSMYGLSVEKLGKIQDFIHTFKKEYNMVKNDSSNNDLKLIKLKFGKRTHLVSINNIMKNYDRIIGSENKYDFFSLSMVLLGGLGPQGHGFTYSTPRGEVVEICSDIKENEAIIVKYKEFLKQQFLTRLEEEMIRKHIKKKGIKQIIDYLTEVIDEREKINYYKKNTIMNKVNSYLKRNSEPTNNEDIKIKDFLKKISNAIEIILRPIKMIDQFKCRMDLLDEDKMNSEDIAKITSLKSKSHYDILRERFFFQNEIIWFLKSYSEELLKLGIKIE